MKNIGGFMNVWLIRRAMGPQTSVEGVFRTHASAVKWFNKNAKEYEEWVPEKRDDKKKIISWRSEIHGGEMRLEKWEVN